MKKKIEEEKKRREKEGGSSEPIVTGEDISEVVSEWTGIPTSKLV